MKRQQKRAAGHARISDIESVEPGCADSHIYEIHHTSR
jgi:hypothetical protein